MSSIASALSDSFAIVHALHATYPRRHRRLDGRLIGDVGETLAEETHEIALCDGTIDEIFNRECRTAGPAQRILFRVGRKQ